MTADRTDAPELSEPEIRRLVGEIAALGLQALADRSYMVRYRACMVLAYSLRADAIPALQPLLQHPDARTREDAARALDAIHHQNHHYFVDRAHSGQSFWAVNETDKPLR